jgi:hypothetical protein
MTGLPSEARLTWLTRLARPSRATSRGSVREPLVPEAGVLVPDVLGSVDSGLRGSLTLVGDLVGVLPADALTPTGDSQIVALPTEVPPSSGETDSASARAPPRGALTPRRHALSRPALHRAFVAGPPDGVPSRRAADVPAHTGDDDRLIGLPRVFAPPAAQGPPSKAPFVDLARRASPRIQLLPADVACLVRRRGLPLPSPIESDNRTITSSGRSAFSLGPDPCHGRTETAATRPCRRPRLLISAARQAGPATRRGPPLSRGRVRRPVPDDPRARARWHLPGNGCRRSSRSNPDCVPVAQLDRSQTSSNSSASISIAAYCGS